MLGPRPRERFPIRQGDEEKWLDFQGRRRTYIVHVPPGFDRSRALPLVIVLHGGVVNAYFTAYNTGMNATADREGFIVAYPNGTGRLEDRILTWNVGFGFAYALRNNVDDVGFIRELINRTLGEYGADPRRVYATGISNGGIMSYRLASEASDLIAAVAPVAGASAGRRRGGSPLVVFPRPRTRCQWSPSTGCRTALCLTAAARGQGSPTRCTCPSRTASTSGSAMTAARRRPTPGRAPAATS